MPPWVADAFCGAAAAAMVGTVVAGVANAAQWRRERRTTPLLTYLTATTAGLLLAAGAAGGWPWGAAAATAGVWGVLAVTADAVHRGRLEWLAELAEKRPHTAAIRRRNGNTDLLTFHPTSHPEILEVHVITPDGAEPLIVDNLDRLLLTPDDGDPSAFILRFQVRVG